MTSETTEHLETITNPHISKDEILNDYRIACESRHASLIGRKEVFMGKAKFGIFGDGKELAQIAMAKAFRKGDWRSGYYRDQTFMFAIGELSLQEYFAQLYAHTDVEAEPATAGRCMNGHFATRSLNPDGTWKNLSKMYNSSADVSPTGMQMPRALGLAYASKLFRQNENLHNLTQFSNKGNEISFVTIGNASTSEGFFYESINAAGVLQIPMLVSVWDDAYGISVSQEYHTTKMSISKALAGFGRNENEKGYEIMTVNGWDYLALCEIYERAANICRKEHIPLLVHVEQMTQPQGHSTSGSHERYKPAERLLWETEHDCIKKMGEWIISDGLANAEELEEINKNALKTANDARNRAWNAFIDSMQGDYDEGLTLIGEATRRYPEMKALEQLKIELERSTNPIRQDVIRSIKKAIRLLRFETTGMKNVMADWLKRTMLANFDRYSSHLYSETAENGLQIAPIPAEYDEKSALVDGRQVLQACFDSMFERDHRVLAFGEDVGKIGDVNQAFAGLQEKYGEWRITDTGIREMTIIGQGIGCALRGLRPIAEIQYLDYLIYGLIALVDDVALTTYRTKGGQKCPLIVRTRGHRLEGIFHSGSPMSMILSTLRGMYVLVPRNMTQAAGMYNTLLKADNPALLIECLNGYRLKERLPNNIAEFTVPLGVPEIIREGTDLTIITYGSMCRIVADAAKQLQEIGISVEIIDVQTLIPFDRPQMILQSIQKTNRVIFADEDVSGGASAYMMQKVLDEQNAYQYLDSRPVCLSAKDHRPAYGSDGDYFSKPNVEDVFDAVYALMSEADPDEFPALY